MERPIVRIPGRVPRSRRTPGVRRGSSLDCGAKTDIVLRENDQGERGEIVVREGEQLYLPKGNRYTLRSTGEPAINIFAIAGGPTSLAAIKGGEAAQAVKAAVARL
jgi:hypothetical protein